MRRAEMAADPGTAYGSGMKKPGVEKLVVKQFLKRLARHNLEIEQKYRVRDIASIRRAMKRMGAVKGVAGREHNELYDEKGRLRRQKYVLRLRYHGADRAWLTFKGPRLKSRHKKRIEIETPVLYEETRRILLLLGFRMVSTYRKYREEYTTHSAVIHLDYLPQVGWFVEIEGRPRTIALTARKLGLDESAHEHRSYRKILENHVSFLKLGR